MLKAKQNSFLKWFIGIVLLIVALCSFMATAFAAPDGKYACSICGKGFAFGQVAYTAKSYETAYSVPSLDGLTNSGWEYYFEANSNGDYVEVASYNNKEICRSCLESKIAEYKAANSLNATVPASLPIHVGEDGKVTTASNASITNNGSKPIEISSINISASSGWTVQSKADAENAKAGSKVIAIGFNDVWAEPKSGNTSGFVNTSGFSRIPVSGTLSLTYAAVIPVAAEKETANETAATATIVVSSKKAPTMAASYNWYKTTTGSDAITKITFRDSYTPTGTIDSWNVDVGDKGDIKCYTTGTELIIAGNGSGKIRANADSSSMFSLFHNLTTIENLNVLDTSQVTNMGSMFRDCSKLTSLDVSNWNTAKVTDMSGMFGRCKSLTSLDVSNFNTANVIEMSSMFAGCSGLTSLDASGFDTSKVTSMNSMFDGCSGLTSLDVSGFNTSNVTNMSSMFQSCSGLTSLDVSGFNTFNVTNMGYMFYYCTGLTNLNVSSFDTSKVTYMGSMFQSCSGLTSLDVSGFNTSNVTNMGSMFGRCSGLTTIYAGDGWNTDKVTSSGSMFYNCTNLKGDIAYNSSYTDKKYAKTSGGYLSLKPATLAAGSEWYKSKVDKSTITKITFVDSYTTTSYDETWNADVDNSGAIKCYRTGTEIIVAGNGRKKISANPYSQSMFSNFTALANLNTSVLDTSNVTNMQSMFFNCGSLTNLDVSHFDTSNVTNMNNIFHGCSGLTTIDLSKWNTSKVSETVSMFYNCANLTNLDLSMWDMSNVKEVAFMFQKCSKLTSLNVSTWNTSKITSFNQMFSGCSGLTSLDVSKWNTSNARIMYAMFYHCSGLTSLNVSNWNTSNVTDMSTMFSGCSALTSLNVSKWNTSNVTDMSDMFFSCEALSSLDVSNFKTSKVTNMEAMFYECRSVTNLDVSNWNTSNVTNMSTMFCYCGSVRNLDVSNFNTAKVTDMNYMFFNCKGVTNLDVSNWNTSNVTDMSDMFCYCEELTSLDISIFDTRKVTDMSWMFAHCTGVTNIYVGDNWNTDKVTSSEYMFYNSRKLPNYNNSKFDVTMATFTSNGGYLTHKAATKSLKLNVDQSGTVNGYTEQSAA